MKRLYKKIPILVFFMVFLSCSVVFADIIELEAAIIERDFESAEDIAQKMLAQNPDTKTRDKINGYLGSAYLSQGKFEDARKVFNKLVNEKLTAKEKDKAYIGLFNSYYLDEQYEEAEKIINKLLKISPKSEYLSTIYLKAARVNLRLTNWDKAYDYLNRIVTKFPKSLEYHSARQLLEEKQYFAVQVGSFLERKRAQSLADELKKSGEYSYIVETTDRQGRKFYRVRVGQLSVLSEAKKLKTKLSRQGYPTQIYP